MDAQILSHDLSSTELDQNSVWAMYLPRLVVFVRAFGGAAASAAEDIAQDIAERALGSIQQFDGRHAFSTWLYRIARNHCIDVGRKTRRRREIRQQHRKSLEMLHTPLDGPSEQLERAEAAVAVAAAVARLSPTDRQLAFLRYYEDLQMAEIANVMEMPIGTVKYRLHELVGRLRDDLEESKG